MAEAEDRALLLRRIPYGETSLICHFLTERHGRIVLMAKGARRPKSPLRAALEPLFALQVRWRVGRTGMGTLIDCERSEMLLGEEQVLDGLELLAIAARLFHEGDPHGFEETRSSLDLLNGRDEHGLLLAIWQLLGSAGWLGDLTHCWRCGSEARQTMFWQHAHLVCESCGGGMAVSAGLRKSVAALLAGRDVRLAAGDAQTWREMVRSILHEHGVKPTESFR